MRMEGSELCVNESLQSTLQCVYNKSIFPTHLLLCGSQRSKYCNQISMVDKMTEKFHNLTTGIMQCPINEDGGWEYCIPYFPLRHSIKHKTDKKETADQEKFSRSTFKFDFNLWMSILKTLQITSVCGFVQLSLFSDWPFHQMSFKIDNSKPQDNCVRCSSHQERNVADYK